jgi:cephalosporin-C deacetylase
VGTINKGGYLKMKMLTGLFLAAMAASAFAGELDNALLKGRTDKDPVLYKPGETMTFTLNAEKIQGPLAPGAYFINWERTGDDGAKTNGSAPLSLEEPLVIKTSLAKPGFVRIYATIAGKDHKTIFREPGKWNSSVFFDGGAAVEPEKLQGVAEPADFDAFWKAQKAKLDKVPIKATRTEVPCKDKAIKMYAVSIDCAGPRPVTGYLTIPVAATAANPMPAEGIFQGYGTNVQRAPGGGDHSKIVLNVNAHGYELGKDEAYYKAFFESIKSNGKAYAFDPEQNKNPETAYFNGMALRVMRTFQYLKTLPEWNKKDLWAHGGSQGGLQTCWAAGLEPQLSHAYPGIPWCCDQGGFTFGRLQAGWRVPYTESMNYYDPINHAKRIPRSCPVDITRAGLGDYTCPPSGVAVLYNNIKAPKSINWVQGSEHGYVPPAPNQTFVQRAE